ncbi:hypothetical protein [Sporomusa sp. KB1]|jgi:hypothetical protein|uniref:hypothetical protein n=1 Tax=Sporomusa sp. KB1 TaxID=943346 RepID=UPI0011ABEB4E|nr:hypothetical protein [Sporomusa sp. KB1]TWH45046.1 hypothetical protein Salpa_0928 [Sporomusa sp. KB1]
MEKSKLMQKLEGYRRRNAANHEYVNSDLYRLFYDKDLYIIAYNSVKSNDGAETSGSDGTSLHGFCQEWIAELIAAMRAESYQPQPNKTMMIPKSNGKMRKLSFLNGIAPKSYAENLKQQIKDFLQNKLWIRLSDEKTKITHSADHDVAFLGTS